jgi:S1-C subfamily serine protease
VKRRRPSAGKMLVPGVAVVILASGIVLALWQSRSHASMDLRSAGSAVFSLRTEVDFDTGEETPRRATLEGTGVVLFNRFVLTVAHAVTQERLEMTMRTPRGELTLPVEGRLISEKTYLLSGDLRVPLVPLVRDARSDLALFRLPEKSGLPSFPFPIGDSEALDLGDTVGVLGSDPAAGAVFRPASVAALRGAAAMKSVTRNDDVFLMSLALTEGESGAPVLVKRNGAYELVGLAQGTYVGPRQLAWAIRIVPALEALARREDPGDVRKFLHLCGVGPRAAMAEPRSRHFRSGTPPSAAL